MGISLSSIIGELELCLGWQALGRGRRWGNRDVYPIPHDKRTYGVYAFVSYWGMLLSSIICRISADFRKGTCGVCLSSWTIGSSLIGIGLTAGQAMASVTVGMLLASINAYLNGTPGAKHHLGYGMLARAAFGMWGSYFCVMLNVFQSFVFYVSLKRVD